MKNLRDQFDRVRGFHKLSCCFHVLKFQCWDKIGSAALAESCAFFVVTDHVETRSTLIAFTAEVWSYLVR
jgi:hypothetical protein